MTSRAQWAVMLETSRRRWGGDLRRVNLFRRLAERTDATVLSGWGQHAVRKEFGVRTRIPVPSAISGRRVRPRLASSELIGPDVLGPVRRVMDPAAVAVFDDPISQAMDLGITLPVERHQYLASRMSANLRAFRWHVVPTGSFASHIGLDLDRVIVAGNGTDTTRIVPGEWPEDPAIGMISGAAPGRGIENLIAAARLVHHEVPEVRLLLWLAATGTASQEHLDAIVEACRHDRWIEISTVAYGDLTPWLRQASVLTIPHPPGAYHDIALPVKLLDSMAAGRPLVVTPRTEVRAIVESYGVGQVTSGDSIDDLANGLRTMILDTERARALGERARFIAETEFDWAVVGERVANAVLEREGLLAQFDGGGGNRGGSTDQSSYASPAIRE